LSLINALKEKRGSINRSPNSLAILNAVPFGLGSSRNLVEENFTLS